MEAKKRGEVGEQDVAGSTVRVDHAEINWTVNQSLTKHADNRVQYLQCSLEL